MVSESSVYAIWSLQELFLKLFQFGRETKLVFYHYTEDSWEQVPVRS